MELEGKSAVVVGMARSGVAAAEFLLGRGARVVAADRKPAAELPPEVTRLQEKGARLALGAHDAATFTAADLVVVSPGVPWDLPELVAARGAGVEVIAELELGFRCLTGTVAAITGTKGKSTTTAALGAMLKAGGQDVRVGGNIGQAVTGLVEGSTEKTVFVLEVSSFQLEGTQAFHPRVAVFLNLSPDHLDRHPSFDDYARAKARIFRNQTEDDWAVVNADDPGVLALAREGRGRPRSSRETRRACAGTEPWRSSSRSRRSACRGRTWRETCWRRPPPPACSAPAPKRWKGQCAHSPASSTSWSEWPRSEEWPSSTIPRPPTWRPRERASRRSRGRSWS